jgi:hypothetical protein
VDWNNDGKKDLIAGDSRGNVTLFLNIGTTKEAKLAEGELVKADGKPLTPGSHNLAGTYSWIHVADWDGDGLKDLFVGHTSTLAFYKNGGAQSAPRLQAPTLFELPGGGRILRPSVYVVDWDDDGKNDLLVGGENPKVYFYRNVGTNKKPKLSKGEALDLKGPGSDAGYRWRIDVTDWDNDGKKDLLLGNFYSSGRNAGGNIWLFLGR